MDNDNKKIIIENIWSNPAPVFGGEWVQKRNAWETQRGAIRLLRTASGENITVWGNHNSGFAGERYDVFTYLQDNVLHTSDFWETLQSCAACYGVDLKLSKEHAEKIQRQRLAREVAASLCSSLMENKGGDVWRYLTEQRGIIPDGIHYGELTAESIRRAKDALSARGYKYDPADFDALKLTDKQAGMGYRLVLPYYQNGAVVGFLFRDITGHAAHKYDTPQGMKRGYCDHLTHGEPAVIVEGELDALRLIAAGVPNVVAVGGAKLSDEITHLLDANDIRQITYIPDTEYNEQGKKKTHIISDAIKGFQAANVDGEQVIKYLYIAEIPTPEGETLNGLKLDADTYGKQAGDAALLNVVNNPREWWDYELSELDQWTETTLSKGEQITRWEFERRFMDIYNRCASPMERERIRQNINGATIYEQNGITPAALLEIDENKRQTDYTNRVKEGLQKLTRAIDEGANPATVGDILARLSEAQNTNTRDEWDQQLNATFADELQAIKDQPDTLRTKWELGNINKQGDFIHYEYIEYYPADIAVFCAPTSHGKTMVLLQSAFDLLGRYPNKTFLYVSCEENNRQLLERALNVYLDIDTNPDGVDKVKLPFGGGEINQNYCFRTGTRKRAIKAALRGGYIPDGYTPDEWERLSVRISEGVKRYGEQVRPRLKLIHTEGSAESIAANVRHYVEQYRAQGVDVGGVFVDYMQLLTSDKDSFSRHDELKDVCKALKDCAARTELPVIIAAQLNRETLRSGVDSVTVANIGEGADIERIAHDIYFIWQTDKTKQDLYLSETTNKDGVTTIKFNPQGDRSRRLFTKYDAINRMEPTRLKRGYLYIEQMKARDGKTDGWGLFPFVGEQGKIGELDKDIMKQ